MRHVIAASLCLLASPALAWEAGVEGALCTLDHSEPCIDVRLTYDPTLPEYTIAISRAEPWPEAAVFAMRFEGPRANMISTTRHVLSDAGRTLSVTDRGFGNVLDGLERNLTALAAAGQVVVMIDLQGAAPEVAAFRACTTAPAV